MNLRTITFWVCYDPAIKQVIFFRQFKKDCRHVPRGCVIVKVKGHYIRPMESCTAKEKR